MARTRAAVLLGARQCIVKHGSRKTTMVDIAATAGVAKATLYNHFRAKSEVYVALVESEVRQAGLDTIEAAEAVGVATALARLAERLGEHPVVRRLAAQEPGVLAGLVLPEQAGGAEVIWQAARDALTILLAGQADVELVLRFLVSQLLWPAGREETVAAVALLVGVASTVEATVIEATPVDVPSVQATPMDVPSVQAAPMDLGSVEVTSTEPGLPSVQLPAAAPATVALALDPPAPAVPGLGWPAGERAAERVGVV